jgi:UDP-perosamine 4-acetyltransferase
LLPEIGLSGHATHFIIAVGAVGPADNRIRLFNAACAAGLIPLTIRAPGSMVSARAKIGAGSALLPCCVVNADASIGVNCIINTTAVIEHDCVVGDHVHVATGAKITGGAAVGIGSFVGAGAVVKHGVRIGARAVIGAGAVVVSDVPDNTTVVGCPARAVRNLK